MNATSGYSRFTRNVKDRRTYKVARPKVRIGSGSKSEDEDVLLRSSVTDDEKISLQNGKLKHGGKTFTKTGGKYSHD